MPMSVSEPQNPASGAPFPAIIETDPAHSLDPDSIRLENDRIRQRRHRASLTASDSTTQQLQNTAARRSARSNLSEAAIQSVRVRDRTARQEARANLPTSNVTAIRAHDTATRQDTRRNVQSAPVNISWWENLNALNASVTAPSLGLRWNRNCNYCGITALTGELIHDRCFVCGPNGSHYVPLLPTYPSEWNFFLDSPNLGRDSRKLNNLFTLTALGVHDGDFMHFPNGISCVTLAGGRTYHRIIPADEGEHPIRWFLHDPWAIFKNGANNGIPNDWIHSALAGLERVNPFIKELENLSVYDDDNEMALTLENPSTITSNEVAAVVSLAPASAPTRRKIMIRRKGETNHIFLDLLSPFVEPLHYLMLLPYGTLGWATDRRNAAGKSFSQARWYRTRFFMNAEQMSYFSRLTGEYLVDAWSAVEESRLTYIRHHQHSSAQDVDEVDPEYVGEGDEEPPDDVRLPSTFVHSPAWSAANIADCLALRKSLGPVTLFITFTTNPKWPEITSQLRPGQNASDRPDIVIRVYQQYLSLLMKDISKLFGPVSYYIRITEFQKRGLPHGHIALALKNVPRTPEEITAFLSSELPREAGPMRDAIKKHMTHNHNPNATYHRCGWPYKQCQYDFPKNINAEAFFNDRGYFQARRREREDELIVSHIPFLILKYDCHINVEYSASVNLFQYLFKYFYKGPDETNWAVQKVTEITASTSTSANSTRRGSVDQIKDYERGRYLSSIEAATRLASFHISVKHPGVKRLPIHLPGRQYGQMKRKDGSESDGTLLVRYIFRPRHPLLDEMTYLDFGAKCRIQPHDPAKPLHSLDILENSHAGRPRMRIRLYSEGHVGVSRIQMVYPRHGDVFYLRALLTHRPAQSWEDLRTVEGTVYTTFQEAARAFGLFTNENEGIMAFRELIELGASPGQLRWLFAVLAVEGEPVIYLWDTYQAEISADVLDHHQRISSNPNLTQIQNTVLLYLQNILRGLGKSLSDVGLPEPAETQRELDAERKQWAGDPGNLSSFEASLTGDQRTIYNRLMILAAQESPPPVHIDGRAGRGKTYTLYPIIGALRKQNEVVLITASSAFAAKNYPGGRTVHHLYGVPVDEYNPFLQSMVRPRSDRAKLLAAAKCHIIDEIGGLHFKAFDCADRLMRTVTQKPSMVWGGKMLITVGDFRQVAPVVRYGGKTAITKASIRTQPVFRQFEILRLHVSIRQGSDPLFSAFLDDIGDQVGSDTVDLSRLRHTNSFQEALDFVFPPDIVAQPDICVRRAILSPYNAAVNEFNAAVLDRLPGDAVTYYSSDTVDDDNDPENPVTTLDLLNSLEEPGIPPHELTLKVGAICRFTRNFDASKGLTKNTRVIVQRLCRFTVLVETLPNIVAGQQLASTTLHIPRIDAHFQPRSFNFVVHRKQIPLALCYATSFNGCQGLTVLKLSLDLRRAVFSHGQLYSAATRVPDSESVLILKDDGDSSRVTTNIVWKELLL